MNIDNIDEIIANADKFMENTVREYKDEIEKYSLEIERGNDTVLNYAHLFQNYRGLYKFIHQKDKKYEYKTRDIVDDVCDKFLEKVQAEMSVNKNMSENYYHLAYIISYKGDNNQALEYFNKAVELDEKQIFARGEFKAYTLHDKQGALEDFNRALELASDKSEKECIELVIDNIDILIGRKSNRFNFVITGFYLIMAFLLAYGCYYFYMMIKVFITMMH